jgi:hypothetical protein
MRGCDTHFYHYLPLWYHMMIRLVNAKYRYSLISKGNSFHEKKVIHSMKTVSKMEICKLKMKLPCTLHVKSPNLHVSCLL